MGSEKPTPAFSQLLKFEAWKPGTYAALAFLHMFSTLACKAVFLFSQLFFLEFKIFPSKGYAEFFIAVKCLTTTLQLVYLILVIGKRRLFGIFHRVLWENVM